MAAAGLALMLGFVLSAGSGTALAQAKGDPAKAQVIVATNCVACHGPDGNSSQPQFPKLAGLQAEYLLKQLNDFKGGRRQNEAMATIIAALNADDFVHLAAYYSEKKTAPGAVRDAKLAGLGRKVYQDGNPETGLPSCAGCHYPDGAGTPRFPRIARQHAEYVLKQLKDFAAGRRENDRGLAMQSVATRMTEAEMRAVAEYLEGL